MHGQFFLPLQSVHIYARMLLGQTVGQIELPRRREEGQGLARQHRWQEELKATREWRRTRRKRRVNGCVRQAADDRGWKIVSSI